tara:strand:- start:626 stop:3580 length:2955 start_codon:yes stop_codon:yes gene_type:complete
MTENITLNIRSIDAFKYISDSAIQKIKDDIEVFQYPIGRPICNKDVIPSKIQVILSGEARFTEKRGEYSSTISILKASDFIGLGSILRAQGCETVRARSDLKTIGLSDKLFLELYKEEKTFKDFCNNQIYIGELYELSKIIQNKSTRPNIDIKSIVNTLSENLNIKILNNLDEYKLKSDLICIAGSANIVNKSIGDIFDSDTSMNVNGPLPGRIFELKKKIFDELMVTKPTEKAPKVNENINDSIQLDIKEDSEFVSTSQEKFGQYSTKKEFKLIKAKGVIRETIACLQMIATEFELPYRSDSIEKLLRDSIRQGKKPTINILGGLTTSMGLHSSGARLVPKTASRLPALSLISWGESFAIVRRSDTNFLEIASPSDGILIIKPEKFEEVFDKGYIEILFLEKNEYTPENKFGIPWLLPTIKKYRGELIQVLIASFVVQLFGLANPLMMQVIIDKVISQRSLDTLQILGFALVIVTIMGGIISSLRTFLFNETTNRIDTRLGAEVIDHLLRLPLGYFDKRPVGELGSRVAELEKIRNFLTGQALTTIIDALFSLIYIIVMVIYSWLLTIVALGVVPIQILITLLGSPLIRRQIRDVAVENASTQSHLVEVLTGIQTVKAQNVERVSRWKWQELYARYISKSFQRTITTTALGETSKVLQQLSQLLVLWIGASLVLKGQLSLGQLIAFRIISSYVTQPLLRLSTIWQNIQELKVSFERLADIVDTKEETTEVDKSKIPLPSIKGSVEFEDISFAFKKGQINILKNINLSIKAGEFIGIVGQSGSGKSTLMKLLPRLYKPQSGRIKIDGYDIDKVELYSLRRQIGIVPQEPLLFAGSVNNNIALTDPEASSDEIIKATKIANAHDFVMNLKDGYSTEVGERGAGLSGGQKQRIAIARTLLSNPKLLILDEATSALDYETEKKVCDGLKEFCTNSTVFFITHRLSTVKNADKIIMLHEGNVAEVGTHHELMSLQGRYYALYLQQESI